MCVCVCVYYYYYYWCCCCRGCTVLRHVLCFCRHEKGCSGVKLGCQYHVTVLFLLIWAVQLLGGANFSRCCVTVAPFHLERRVYPTHTHTHTLNSVALVRTRTIPTERPPPVGEVSATHTHIFILYKTPKADFRRLKCNCYLYMQVSSVACSTVPRRPVWSSG